MHCNLIRWAEKALRPDVGGDANNQTRDRDLVLHVGAYVTGPRAVVIHSRHKE